MTNVESWQLTHVWGMQLRLHNPTSCGRNPPRSSFSLELWTRQSRRWPRHIWKPCGEKGRTRVQYYCPHEPGSYHFWVGHRKFSGFGKFAFKYVRSEEGAAVVVGAGDPASSYY